MGIKAIDSRVPAAERGLVMKGVPLGDLVGLAFGPPSTYQGARRGQGLVMQEVPLGHDDYVQGFLTKNLRAQVELMRRLSTYVPNRHRTPQRRFWCPASHRARVHHLLRALPPSATHHAAFAARRPL